jgi:hypothetical protein
VTHAHLEGSAGNADPDFRGNLGSKLWGFSWFEPGPSISVVLNWPALLKNRGDHVPMLAALSVER